jgi:hypothetical protein
LTSSAALTVLNRHGFETFQSQAGGGPSAPIIGVADLAVAAVLLGFELRVVELWPLVTRDTSLLNTSWARDRWP